MNAESTVPTMPEAVEAVEVQALAPVVCGAPQRKGGFQKKVDKLTRRIHMLQELLAKLEVRCSLQETIITKLGAKLHEREAQWNRKR